MSATFLSPMIPLLTESPCFQGTGVYVARVGRQAKTREYKDLEAHFTANLGYSHHQKAVILDAPATEDTAAANGDAKQPRQASLGLSIRGVS